MDSGVTEEQTAKALTAAGLYPTDEMIPQAMILLNCLALYQERDQKYGSVWKRLGALNNLTRMSIKIERLLSMYWHKKRYIQEEDNGQTYDLDLDDAYDLINYSCFFIRQATRNEWTRG